MKTCPCCSYPLLRHLQHHHAYWYCSHCRQEMPDLCLARIAQRGYPFTKKLSPKLRDF